MLAIGYVCRKAAFRAKPLKSGLTAIGHFAVGRQRAPVPVIRGFGFFVLKAAVLNADPFSPRPWRRALKELRPDA